MEDLGFSNGKVGTKLDKGVAIAERVGVFAILGGVRDVDNVGVRAGDESRDGDPLLDDGHGSLAVHAAGVEVLNSQGLSAIINDLVARGDDAAGRVGLPDLRAENQVVIGAVGVIVEHVGDVSTGGTGNGDPV